MSRWTVLTEAWRRRSLLRLAWAFSVLAFSALFLLDAWHVYRWQSAALDRQHDRVLVRVANIWASSVHAGHQTAEEAIAQAYPDEFNGWPVEGYRHGVSGRSGRHLAGTPDVQAAATGVFASAWTSEGPVLGSGVYRGEPVRMASVAVHWGHGGAEPAVLTVVEPPQLRVAAKGTALRAVFWQTLLRWMLALAIVAILLWQLLRPLHALRDELESRSPSSVTPMAEQRPAELVPVVRTLNQLIAAQRASVQQQREFLADASHQLRTPLAVLRTQLQGLASGQLSVDETLPKMLRTVDRSTNLANQLLSVAKVDQLTQEASWVPVELATVVGEVGLEFGPLMARKRLDFGLDAVPVLIRTDAWMLGELIRNLVANAIHHSPPGAAMGIVIRRLRHEVELIVWDRGGGVSETVQERLFEPFTAAKGGTGIGLGLAICKKIADAMSARVYLFNRQELGVVVGCDAVVRWPLTMVIEDGGDPNCASATATSTSAEQPAWGMAA